LEKRHGNHFTVSEAFRDRLHEWPTVTGRNSEGLRSYSDLLRQCQMAMENMKGLEMFNDCTKNKQTSTKLPEWLVQRWAIVVANSAHSYPPFSQFVRFITKEAEIACNPIASVSGFKGPPLKEEYIKISRAKKRAVGANTK